MSYDINAYYTGAPTREQRRSMYGLSWKEKYAADKDRKLKALAAGKTSTEANAIAYSHQIAYNATPRGKSKISAWKKSPAGKESQKMASRRYLEKMMADPDSAALIKERRRLAAQKYRAKVKIAIEEKKAREAAMVADLVDDNQ